MNLYDLMGVSPQVEFGKNGLIIDGSPVRGYFTILLADGVTVARLQVGNGTAEGDAVNLGQLNLKLDANKVVTDIEAGSGYIADAPTVKAAIAAQISALIGSAPAAYDTLQEIALWLEDHQDLYEALLTTVGNKLDANKVTDNISATAGNVPDAPTVKSYVDQKFADVQVVDKCRKVHFTYQSGTEFNLGAIIPAGEWAKEATVNIVTPFNDINAALDLGDDANHLSLLSHELINLQKVNKYGDTVFKVLNVDTQFKGFLNAGTSTQGEGYILIEFC